MHSRLVLGLDGVGKKVTVHCGIVQNQSDGVYQYHALTKN